MGRGRIIAVSLVLLLTFVVSCVPQATAPSPAPVSPAAAPIPKAPALAVPATSVKAAWEKEWENTLQGAKNEGVVMLATSTGAEGRRQLGKGFEDAIGIRLEGVAGSIGALSSKILAERRAGLYLWDVAVGGSGSQLTILKAGGGMGPTESALILPDLTDPEVIKKVWFGGKLPWVDKDHKLFAALLFPSVQIGVNSNLVKPGDIKSWEDLLNPKWKGKILFMDPTIPGNLANNTMPMLYLSKGDDWVRRLVQQVGAVVRDDRLAHDWLAHGKYAVYITPREETFLEFIKAGAQLADILPEEGAVLGASASSVSLIDRAAHPNAARLFINWYLSKEGQTVIGKAYGGQSARLDVPTDFLRPNQLRQEGAKYFLKEQEDVLLKINEFTLKSREIFADLLK